MTTFDTTPDARFLRAMQNQSWTVHGAISELVDNSFGPGRGNADQVHIVYDPRKRTLAVLDNGQGMEAIGRLFQLGNTIGRSPGDIGLYGSGGTGTEELLALVGRLVAVRISRPRKTA